TSFFHRLPQNEAYPAVVDAVAALPVRDAILDGEATGVWGKQGKVAYHVFDILRLEGEDTTLLTLDERRAVASIAPSVAATARRIGCRFEAMGSRMYGSMGRGHCQASTSPP
ncbi:MAG: hypothetical protein ABJA83_15055, partial [Burkholderiaceae bacterium]